MKLTHIECDGLKNLARVSTDVPPLAVHGDNGSGKTALRQAILLGTLGYDPAVGKRLLDTRKLLDDDRDAVRVALSFDNGFGARRTIGDSMEVAVQPDKGERTIAAAETRIRDETGAFVYALDLGPFLALSSEKRKEALFALLPRELGEVDADLFRRWLGYAESDSPIQRAIDRMWTDHLLKANSHVDGLAACIKFANDQKNLAEQARQAQEKVLAAAEADAVRTSADAVAFDEAELPRLQTALSAVEQELGEQNERLMAVERAERQARERLHQRDVLEMRYADAVKALRAAGERLEQVQTGPLPEIDLLEAETEQARQAATANRHNVTDAQAALSAATAELRVATNALKTAQARLSELESHDECPTCGSVASLVEARVTARAAVDEREIDVAGWYTRLEETEAAAREAVARQNGLDQAETGLRRSLEVARQAVSAREHAERDLASARAQHDQLEAQLLMLKQSSNGAAIPTVDSARVNELVERAAGLRTAIAAQQAQLRETGRAQAERDRAAREREKLATLEYKETALKSLFAGLQKLRTHVITAMVGPVEEQANELLQSIDARKTFVFQFEREGRAEFDFGFVENERFRGFDAASKGEQAFLAVVFVAALVAAVQPVWRVLLIDDFEAIAKERRRWLMVALASVRHLFDNVLITGCPDSMPDVEGWEIRHVSEIVGAPRLVAVS